jgi:hypothetical protein
MISDTQFEAWLKMGQFGLSPHKNASLDWITTAPGERALAEAAHNASSMHFIAEGALWTTVMFEFHNAISAYLSGTLDLDTALNQINAAALADAP